MGEPETVVLSPFDPASELLTKASEDGVFPGAVAEVNRRGTILYRQAFGMRSTRSSATPDPLPMRPEMVFDVAGLTIPLVTTTIIMRMMETGKLRLNDRVSRYVQAFGVLGKSSITIAQLLSHTSGLPHWEPYFEELLAAQAGNRRGIITSRGARDYIVNAINRIELKNTPGSKQIFSDLGFILLGHVIEMLSGLSLDRAAQRYVFAPLGLKSTSYVDLSMIKRRGIHPVTDLIAPTEDCPWRKRVLCGEVHDDNAWAMGGIAGHSGVFCNAGDLTIFAQELSKAYRGESQFLKPETVREFWVHHGDEAFCLGWERPSRENGMLECGLSDKAVGHNSFTGCSLWLEPEEGLSVVLLTNRIHPSESNKKLLSIRPKLYEVLIQSARGA